MNKKGFTIVELIVSFSLAITIGFFLFKITIIIKDLYTDSYIKTTIDDGNAKTKQALELNASTQKAFDSYMSAWESRSKSYDIMSQKQSDATLGYERVYDTENGDIYKAYNGFTDNYDGERYKPITDDMYTQKTYGYIEK